MTTLSAGPPLERLARPVGRRSIILVDAARAGRTLPVDIWYPAAAENQPLTHYEVLPGISFESAAAQHEAVVASGRFPLIVLSHGRTGMRYNYSLLCESLAARGAVVAASDHPGDALNDWLTGTFVDDRTNEINRVADNAFVLDALLGGDHGAPNDVAGIIDEDRIAVIGHSYGAYTGLAAAAGRRGMPADSRVRAVVGIQPFTRTVSDAALSRVRTPTLLVLSEFDTTAPPAIDGDRPWDVIPARPLWRFDLGRAAHHASSDMGLYLELAARLGDLPPMVTAYVAMMTAEMVGPHLRPWREGLLLQVRAIWAFLDVALAIDRSRGEREAEALAATEGVVLSRRSP